MKTYKTLLVVLAIAGATACQNDAVDSTVEGKKERLKQLKAQVQEIESEITQLESQIASEDPDFGRKNVTLVATAPTEQKRFTHMIEVRGSVRSRKNVTMSAETMGRIRDIYVKVGDKVKKGQLLVRIDAETIENRIDELKKAYELAKIVYERQSNLWENKIGSEIQYLEAKNNKEMLERQLSTARSQLAQASLKAPFDGNIDDLMVKQGEMAQPGLPMLTIVSFDDMYIEADISERYISSFKTGDSVQVEFPALNRSLKSYIKSVGNVINEKSRTFKIEIQLPPNGEDIKPNLTAILNMVDYAADNALVIPTNIIQQDAKGHFVYVVDTSGEDPVSRKVHIERGVSYQGETQVVAGLEAGQTLVSQGYRDVADGMNIRIVNQNNGR